MGPSDAAETANAQSIGIAARLARLFGSIAVAGTTLALFSQFHWFADLASQFRVQYLIFIVPALFSWCRNAKYLPLLVGSIVLVANSWFVVPYFFIPEAKTIKDDRQLRILVSNVLRTNTELSATFDEILDAEPDFVFLMEVSPSWVDILEAEKELYPHQKLICRKDYTGVAFLSKHAWVHCEIVDTNDPNPPLEIEFSGFTNGMSGFRIIATHPLPPFGAAMTATRDRQLDVLARRKPTMMIGDFNLTPWSPRFANVLERGQLRDASLGYGITPTLTTLPTLIGGLRVDHVLVDSNILVRGYSLRSMSHSDHRSVVVDFLVTEAVP